MSNVTLKIGPKSYTVACADGEEAHIAALGAIIAEKYAQLGASRAPLEAQNLLFAALFLADELAEARKKISKAPKSSSAPANSTDPQAIEALRTAIAELEDDLAAARAQAAVAPVATAPQTGPASDPAMTEAMAEQLEELATLAEASASALEAAAASA